MCLIVIAWRAHPEIPCLVAANRDEDHGRPTAAAHWWTDRTDILAGRDLMAGGTWIGITRTGRFAAVTNFRDPGAVRADAPSRGSLVRSFLESTASVAEGLANLRKVGADYSGFCLLLSDGERLGVYESVRGEGRELGPGVFGLSNHLLDTPWPKVTKAKARLLDALRNGADRQSVLALLRDETPAPDAQLPRTGVSLQTERLLSSAFIRAADYGTRSSTRISIDRSRRVCFDEWSWDGAGAEIGSITLQFELQSRQRPT
ncbi:MAG: NRDE family protein [Steroidobacteraceae bacterium]